MVILIPVRVRGGRDLRHCPEKDWLYQIDVENLEDANEWLESMLFS